MSQESKTPHQGGVSRRGFVRAGAAALGTAAFAKDFARAWAQEGEETKPTPIPRRKLGNTGVEVPIVCTGTMPGPTPAVILRGLEWGINYVHTCIRYTGGRAIRAVAEAIKGKRDQFLLGWKFWNEQELDEGLRILGTDHVDFAFFHNTDQNTVMPDKLEWFEGLKKAGKARYVGLTAHSFVETFTQKGVDLGLFNILMPRCNIANHEKIDAVVKAGSDKGMGGIAIKTWEGLKREGPGGPKPEDYLKFWASVLQKAHWSSVCKTPATITDIDTWGRFALKPEAYADEAWVERMVAERRGLTCHACGTCTTVCPAGVDPCEILRYEMYALEYGEVAYARSMYAELPPGKTFAACTSCDACTRACPGGLNVADRLRRTHSVLA